MIEDTEAFPAEIVEIVIDYLMFDRQENEDNVLLVMLKSLPNDLQTRAKEQYGSRLKESKRSRLNEGDGVNRRICFNLWSDRTEDVHDQDSFDVIDSGQSLVIDID